MKDPIKLKELIIEQVNLADVMVSYHVHFLYNPKAADEAQFKCPFHGKDNKPSARLYNATKTCYCWVCRKAWDVVSFIMEKEHLSFSEALKFIVNKYEVDTSSIPDNLVLKFTAPEISDIEVKMKFLHTNILSLRGKVPLEKYQALCMGFMMAERAKSQGMDISESQNKIEDKLNIISKEV
jgi:hypothetical protein